MIDVPFVDFTDVLTKYFRKAHQVFRLNICFKSVNCLDRFNICRQHNHLFYFLLLLMYPPIIMLQVSHYPSNTFKLQLSLTFSYSRIDIFIILDLICPDFLSDIFQHLPQHHFNRLNTHHSQVRAKQRANAMLEVQ